jgi:uncharacterized protein YqjF (DUF2071 family)
MVMSDHTGVCPFRIERPVMVQRWETLTFLHWGFDPAAVQRLLPSGLNVETHDGLAWVGLVPFAMHISLPGRREVPWASRFPETNVRTYVYDGDGRSGIWFFSLDAARLGAVVVARTTFRLPYFWSEMEVGVDGSMRRYQCQRRWPGLRWARSRVVVRVGEPYAADALTPFDHFLTARWLLFSVSRRFSVSGTRRRLTRACHDPWPLQRATAVEWDDTLIQAAGLPAPQGAPIVHYSPGVDVQIGRPERC